MKKLLNFLTFTILFAASVLPIKAQQVQKMSSDDSGSVERGIFTKYDKTKHETTVYIYPYLKIHQSEPNFLTAETLTMTAGFSHTGKDLVSKPDSIELRFVSTVKTTWRFTDERERKLTIIVDNERFELPSLNRIKTSTFPVINQQNLRYVENMAMFVPFETFKNMAHGKKVTVKIGAYDIKLRKEHLEVLRELLSRT